MVGETAGEDGAVTGVGEQLVVGLDGGEGSSANSLPGLQWGDGIAVTETETSSGVVAEIAISLGRLCCSDEDGKVGLRRKRTAEVIVTRSECGSRSFHPFVPVACP